MLQSLLIIQRCLRMAKTSRSNNENKIPIAPRVEKKTSPTFVTGSALETIEKMNEEKIVFSLRFFDRSQEEAFNCGGTPEGWYIAFMDHLKAISDLSKKEFLFDQKHKNHYRAHGHDWDRLDYKYHLPRGLFEQVESECLQFSLSTSGGRVHGFMIKNTFFVVWLDPHHNLYPDERFGGVKFYERPWTSYEELQYRYRELERENAELVELLDTATK